MSKSANSNNTKKVLKSRNTYKVLCISLVIFIVALVFLLFGWFKDFANNFLIVSAVLIIFEIFMKREFRAEMAVTVAEAINADVTFLKEKMGGEVDSIIKSCLEAKLCNQEKARSFFDGLISPAISLENHRKTFKYTITFGKLYKDSRFNDVTFGKDSYFSITEDLTFEKPLNLKNGMELAVAVCFYDHQIAYYRDKECIYRTILKVKDTEKNTIKTIKEVNSFLENIVKIEMKIGSEDLKPQSMSEYDDMKGFKIIYKYEGKEIKVDKETEVKIKIETYHDKEINYYTAYLFDPTYEPKIKLEYNDDMKNPFDITYLMSSTREARLDPPGENYIRISTKIPEWVFPTSGVVFMWTPR